MLWWWQGWCQSELGGGTHALRTPPYACRVCYVDGIWGKPHHNMVVSHTESVHAALDAHLAWRWLQVE